MNDSQFDRQLHDWLRRGPSGASPRVLATVAAHVRSRPAGRSLGDRWSGLVDVLVPRRRAVIAIRPLALLVLLALAFALGAFAYAAWQRNRTVVVPLPSLTPAPSATLPVAPTPGVPSGVLICPPGTDPDRPGPVDQPRPQPGAVWNMAIDSQSGVLILPAAQSIWVFDLCTNTWRQTDSFLIERDRQTFPIYDADSDVTVFLGSAVATGYDADADTVIQISSTPTVGNWSGVYDPLTGLVLARLEDTSRMWTYDVETDEWREIGQSGDVPGVRSRGQGIAVSTDVLAFDSSADRVVMYRPNSPGVSPDTYEFDPRTYTWTHPAVTTARLEYSFYDVVRAQAAYEESHALAVVYNHGRLIAYDAKAHTWATLVEEPGVRSSAKGVAMAYDPVNGRIVAVGSGATASASPAPGLEIDDVSAFDAETHTWSQLLAQTPVAPRPSPSAGPLSACPADSSPDQPGPVGQERPGLAFAERLAFDHQSGRLVVVDDAGDTSPTIWSFDVCTNTWDRSPASLDAYVDTPWENPNAPAALAYDESTDVTLFFGQRDPGRVLTFDVDTDVLDRKAYLPDALLDPVHALHAVYRSSTAQLIVRDDYSSRMWIYETEADAWHELEQAGDIPPGPNTGAALLAYDASVDRLILYIRSGSLTAGYEYDFADLVWTRQPIDPPEVQLAWGDLGYGEIAYDEAHARTVVIGGGRIIAYDATSRDWQILVDADPGPEQHGGQLVYDPLNERIVAVGGELAAFNLDDLSWTVLLASTAP